MTPRIVSLGRSLLILGPPFLELEWTGRRWIVRDAYGRKLGTLPSADA